MAPPEKKKTRGRQKLPLEPMKKQSNRLVTFSKRRLGLFKKASELCTLCGASASVVVFSPARKAFAFGHPSVLANVTRFLTGGLVSDTPGSSGSGAQQSDPQFTENYARAINYLNSLMEGERKATEEYTQARKMTGDDKHWLVPLEEVQSSPHLHVITDSASELLDKLQAYKDSNTLAQVTPLVANYAPVISTQNPGQVADHYPPPQVPVVNDHHGSFGDQGQTSFLMEANPTLRGPDDQITMIPTPKASVQENGSTFVPINPPQQPISNEPMVGGFVPNFPTYQGVYYDPMAPYYQEFNNPVTPYQGVNNPWLPYQAVNYPAVFGAQLQHGPPASYNMADSNIMPTNMAAPPAVTPGTSQTFTSLLMDDSQEPPNAPFDSQGGSQFGPGSF